MNVLAVALGAWLVMAMVMYGLWRVQLRTSNAGIVDIAWTFGVGATGVALAIVASGDPARRWLVGCIAAVWSVRLGVYLARRVLGEEEDGRYREMRERWGDDADRKMLGFYQMQAAWVVLFAMPMLAAAMNDAVGLRWHDWAGLGVFVVSIVGEHIADGQLARFRRDPSHKGQVCRVGLWGWSRHPNYFFEWVHWFAYLFIAIGTGWVIVAAIGVVVMYLFLTRVTGIPPTERRAIASRGDAYRQYQREVSALIPLPPTITNDTESEHHAA